MKTKLTSTVAALCLAILAALTITRCKSTGGNANGGTHSMGSKTNTWPMDNKDMAGYH
ncbi:MAG: hypothetical protein JWO08_3027 [Verrucomicrobiaceae bacterium]|nr:hypothetical protein [Verrucomicrobiaceae bacterium]